MRRGGDGEQAGRVATAHRGAGGERADHRAATDFVAVAGGLLLLYGVGTMIGPLAASAAMGGGNPAGLFAVTATAHLAIAGYALYRTTRRAPVPETARDAYRTVPGQTGTPQTAALDPRAEDAPPLDRDTAAIVK